MRLFVAIELDPNARRQIGNVQDALIKQGVKGNYTPPENLHLTLAFLGERSEYSAVLAALKRVKYESFTIETDRPGRFGGVWWVGISQCAGLERLAQAVREALDGAGIAYDRKAFRGHITILRRPDDAGDRIPEIPTEPVSMKVDRFSLMRSDRGSRGMVYTPLGSIPARESQQ